MKIKLNDKWTIKTAKELYTYTSGISKGSQFFGTGYPYLTFTEIFHNYFVPEVLTSLVQSNERERENCSIKRGDVFLTRTSETDDELGMSCVALKDYPNATFNGFTKRLRPLTDEVVPEYAGFYFRSPIFRAAVTSMSSIITRASLNEKMLDKLPICYPSKPIQQKIASILSAYDNLIQNYKKQIEALQTVASELYKEWFVRFRFPGWQNAKIENGIPEGWKVERIGALYDSTSGGTPSREHEEYFQNGTYPWIKTGELKDSPILETEESITDEAIKHSSAKLFEKDSLIIAMYGATIGQLGINKMKATCNQACCVLRPKKDKAFGIYYLFHFFKENREFIIGLGNGAAQQNLSQVLINKLKIVNPNKEILEIFEEKESMFFEKIYHLQQQITNLTQQRDLLLPRLMSGKLEVK